MAMMTVENARAVQAAHSAVPRSANEMVTQLDIGKQLGGATEVLWKPSGIELVNL